MDIPSNFSGMKVTVMGLGVFGGGAGVTRFLVEQGARVTVTDLRSAGDLSKGLALIQGLPVEQVLGQHRDADFCDADLVIANPAVPLESPYLEKARQAGVPVESEMNLTLRLLPSRRVIGVTGSNGKTTTSHLIHHMLTAAGEHSWLGGNMGGSLLVEIDKIGSNDPVVLELSSFQLERSGPKGLGPDIGVITNLTPNHLDRHRTFEAYVEAKAWIFARARGAVLNAEDKASMKRFHGRLQIPTLLCSSRHEMEEGYFLRNGALMGRRQGSESLIMETREVRLPGVFNLENMMTALAAADLIRGHEPLPAAARAAGASFKGVPHRLEVVASKGGVTYINDSIATTPESCCAALEALKGDVHLIAGGYDKELPLDDFARTIARKACSVFLIGVTGPKLGRAIVQAIEVEKLLSPRIEQAERLETAIKLAAEAAKPGSIVLLSPGFASYDQFLNFVERGDCFRRCVAQL